jgi:hypothetical protein
VIAASLSTLSYQSLYFDLSDYETDLACDTYYALTSISAGSVGN